MDKTPNKGNRWTKKDDSVLIRYWGQKHPKQIAKILGRTLPATKRRAYIVLGTKKMNRGGYSVRSLAEETGYHPTQVRKAIMALNLDGKVKQKGKHNKNERRWGKSWDNRTWLLNERHTEKILAWLRDADEYSDEYRLHFHPKGCKLDRWAKEHDKCIGCGTTEKKHQGKGLCYSCRAKPRLAKMRAATARRKRKRARWWDAKRKLTCCTQCSEARKPHHAKGLCDVCYQARINQRKAAH